jgi:hypothetical protein
MLGRLVLLEAEVRLLSSDGVKLQYPVSIFFKFPGRVIVLFDIHVATHTRETQTQTHNSRLLVGLVCCLLGVHTALLAAL